MDKINELQRKLEQLIETQNSVYKEITFLKTDIYNLKSSIQKSKLQDLSSIQSTSTNAVTDNRPQVEIPKSEQTPSRPKINPRNVGMFDDVETLIKDSLGINKVSFSFEKFLGENLVSKIGVIILLIGVIIGAKYSFDHDLISPVARITMGYVLGLSLLVVSLRLKSKYLNYSAVVLSGAMSILYFVTYAAFGLYELFPQSIAFVIMFLLTAFTVVASLSYDRSVIALIGLVGAYAVPFLLSDGSGNILFFLTYVAVINVGIGIIGIKKYWKSIYYTSFLFTWIIFTSWYFGKYDSELHFTIALVYLTLFFVLFYVLFLGNKLVNKEQFSPIGALLLVANASIFFGLGLHLLNSNVSTSEYLGLFTLVNAVIHMAVGYLIKKNQLADTYLFQLVLGMVIVFVSLVFPIQLDGNWVTLFWALEAALLFWIGCTKNIKFYEYFSHVLMIVALFSLFQDWNIVYECYEPTTPETELRPILNFYFITSIMFVLSFAFINYIHFKTLNREVQLFNFSLVKFKSYFLPLVLVFISYMTFRLEIYSFFNQLYYNSIVKIKQEDYENLYYNQYILSYETISYVLYSLIFAIVISIFNKFKIQNSKSTLFVIVVSIITILYGLTSGLYEFSIIRDGHLTENGIEYFKPLSWVLYLRYVFYVLVFGVVYAVYTQRNYVLDVFKFKISFEIGLHVIILWCLSSELINQLDLHGSQNSYKLGLSILWGIYSLLMIALGMWKSNKPLRIGALVLFAITLLKLFVYDIADLDTISKIVVLMILGVLLLIISFLYNKYKNKISINENS